MIELPKEYTPSSLLPVKPPHREEIIYAIGEEQQPNSFAMWHGPNPDLFEMLEVVGRSNRSCIILFSKDGTDEIIYRWKKYRNGKPPKWIYVGEEECQN